MGIYMYVCESDRTTKRKVQDPDVNADFQDALRYDPSLMIEERHDVVRKGFFGKKIVTHFQIYHETPGWDGSAYQARYQMSGSGGKEIVTAYLHGIINGALKQLETPI